MGIERRHRWKKKNLQVDGRTLVGSIRANRKRDLRHGLRYDSRTTPSTIDNVKHDFAILYPALARSNYHDRIATFRYTSTVTLHGLNRIVTSNLAIHSAEKIFVTIECLSQYDHCRYYHYRCYYSLVLSGSLYFVAIFIVDITRKIGII